MTRAFVPSSGIATKGFHFGLGSAANPESLVWRAWTRDDEVHVAVHPVAGSVELTAYPTGRWRIEIGGVVSRWHRPREFRPGWTRGPDILLPGGAVLSEPAPSAQRKAEPIVWLRPPEAGQLARLQLWFAIPGADEARWRQALGRSTASVVVLPLRRAGTLHLVRQDEAADVPDRAGPPSGKLREVIVRADQTGRPSFWETVA